MSGRKSLAFVFYGSFSFCKYSIVTYRCNILELEPHPHFVFSRTKHYFNLFFMKLKPFILTVTIIFYSIIIINIVTIFFTSIIIVCKVNTSNTNSADLPPLLITEKRSHCHFPQKQQQLDQVHGACWTL